MKRNSNNFKNSKEVKMAAELIQYRRICSCGCSSIIYPTMKREYTLCRYCQKKLFKDIEKQKEYDKQIEKENFRLKMNQLMRG